jgi:hypothetical protein
MANQSASFVLSAALESPAPRLGVVVTNYETWDLTRRCLERVVPFKSWYSILRPLFLMKLRIRS